MSDLPSAEVELVFGAGAEVSSAEQLRRTPPVATGGLWRVSTASDSAILKLVRLEDVPGSRWPAAPGEDDPYYWRREPLAYASGLLERLNGGLRAPRCRACVERPDGTVALWLEDVGAGPDWTPDLLGEVAHRLGLAQAELAVDPPRERWLSRGWLRAYLVLHGAPDPDLPRVLARLDAAPVTLCHHDLHPANVLGGDAAVVVDWAYCGLAAVGLDAGVLVADGVADGAIAPRLAGVAGRRVWEGYATGLREGGWSGRLGWVRYAYLRGTALRLSWLAPRLETLPDDHEARPGWEATVALLDRWRDQARELA